MMHHDCSFRENDMDGLLGRGKRKPTVAGVGEDGHLRCCSCKRKVRTASGETHPGYQPGPEVEAPYPKGWCSDPPEPQKKEVRGDE
jgi:hypothetical protein